MLTFSPLNKKGEVGTFLVKRLQNVSKTQASSPSTSDFHICWF